MMKVAASAGTDPPSAQGCCAPRSEEAAPQADAAMASVLPPGGSWLDAMASGVGDGFAAGDAFGFSAADMPPLSFDFAGLDALGDEAQPTAPGAPAAAMGAWMPLEAAAGGAEHEIDAFGIPDAAWLASLGVGDAMGEAKLGGRPEDGRGGEADGQDGQDGQQR